MTALPERARVALAEVLDRNDPGVVGLVLSGSAARGLATEWSDVDVYVVMADKAHGGDEIRRSPAVDEIPVTLAELERPAPFGTDGWWLRWSFAWAQVLRDHSGGRVAAAVHRQATLTRQEQSNILPGRLDGFINFVYRALKTDREGRSFERRLDAAECIPWLLDVIFTLSGRVRPYNKYLTWELREHPLEVDEWSAERLRHQLGAILDGDPDSLRAAFAVVQRECLKHDDEQGQAHSRNVIDGWGDQLKLLRG